MTLRLNIWSGPRNVSTALMYAFGSRADTQVVDEPLYGHYLRVSGAPHPGAQQVMAAMECDGVRVVQDVVFGQYDAPLVVFKQMAHHLIELDLAFLKRTQHIVLTRNPQEMLPSLSKNIPNPTLRDTGYASQMEILNHLIANGQEVSVIEAKQLLLNPKSVLSQLCLQLIIPFDPAMLRWPAGPKPYDGVWAEHWYHNVHRSTEFQPYRPKQEPFPDALKPLLAECVPLFEQLNARAIKAESNESN